MEWRTMSRFLVPAAIAVALHGCGEGEIARPDGPTVSHSDGWSVVVPDSATFSETADGFLIRPHGDETRRSADIITVARHSGHAQREGWAQRDIGGAVARYKVEMSNGGSGGAEYRVTIVKPFCGDMLTLEQSRQREFGGEPDFSLAWGVIAAARCQDGG